MRILVTYITVFEDQVALRMLPVVVSPQVRNEKKRKHLYHYQSVWSRAVHDPTIVSYMTSFIKLFRAYLAESVLIVRLVGGSCLYCHLVEGINCLIYFS